MSNIKRTALVTGAGRGIGRAIAKEMALDGVNVIGTSRTKAELEELRQEIQKEGGSFQLTTVDLTERSQTIALVDELRAMDINILVNNAGIGSSQNPRPIVDYDDSFWDLTLEINVTAPYLLTRLLLPQMLELGFGRIINISSINSKVPALHGAAYTASKHAIAGLTKATALEVAGSGVTANAICPGVTATLMNDLRIQYDAERTGAEANEVEARSTPYGRRLTPDEIAPLAKFLAREESVGINGQLINVCGGTVMS